jgi:hypothetical protein
VPIAFGLSLLFASGVVSEYVVPDRIVILGKERHPILAEAFERLTPALISFADDRDIAAECYKHDFGSWQFIFRHPKGGAASIQFSLGLNPQGEVTATIYRNWWIDDEVALLRRATTYPSVHLHSLDPAYVREELDAQLLALLDGDPASLTHTSRIMPPIVGSTPTYGPFNLPRL